MGKNSNDIILKNNLERKLEASTFFSNWENKNMRQ
jgi:hypothetical protein